MLGTVLGHLKFTALWDLQEIVIVGPSPHPEKHSLTEVDPRPTLSSKIDMPWQDETVSGNPTAQVTHREQ